MTTDPTNGLLNKARLMWSNVDRASRAWRVGEWALLRQVRPDGSSKPRDPFRFLPDKGSVLDLDDAHFIPGLGERLVSSTARFPVMNAAECLVGASQAFGASLQQKRTSTLSTGILCRSAIENSAKTIWLLADPRRATRRARCLGYTEREIRYQEGYIAAETRFLAARTDDGRDAAHRIFAETEQRYRERLKLLTSLPKSARQYDRPRTTSSSSAGPENGSIRIRHLISPLLTGCAMGCLSAQNASTLSGRASYTGTSG